MKVHNYFVTRLILTEKDRFTHVNPDGVLFEVHTVRVVRKSNGKVDWVYLHGLMTADEHQDGRVKKKDLPRRIRKKIPKVMVV